MIVKVKSLVISVIIGALIVWGSAAYTNGLEKISENLIFVNKSVAENLNEENYDSALMNIETLKYAIEQKRSMLEATGKHNELDEIEINIAELKTYVENQKREEALVKCSRIEYLFIHLPKNFRLRIENIL